VIDDPARNRIAERDRILRRRNRSGDDSDDNHCARSAKVWCGHRATQCKT